MGETDPRQQFATDLRTVIAENKGAERPLTALYEKKEAE